MRTPYLALCALLLTIGLSVGCDRQEKPTPTVAKPVVVTTLYPLYEFARQLAGDRMEVQLLLPPGVEPHHFEPTPDDLARIHRAALFVYIGPFLEPWAERVIAGVDRQKVRVVAAAEKVKLLPAPPMADTITTMIIMPVLQRQIPMSGLILWPTRPW